MTVEIRPLAPSDLDSAVRLLAQLNPEVPAKTVRRRFETILTDHPHYQAYGAYSDTTLVGLAGGWVATKVWCGLYLEIDNLVIDPEHRSSGIGTILLNALEQRGKELGCNILVLDSYVSNSPSHRLYHRLGYEIRGFHFVNELEDIAR
ncbi:MAG: GNAT family N-acetyltransferase [Verrucomicrobiales bacterium]